MRRKRVYFSICLSPGVIWLFVSLFIDAINTTEIKENSGVNYDSSNKGVMLSTDESHDVNFNSKDAENLNFSMDTDSVVISDLKLWDFKDTVTFDVIQNEKVSLFLYFMVACYMYMLYKWPTNVMI